MTEPVDPDVDLTVPAQRRELDAAVLASVAVGGGAGAAARHGAALLWPTGPGAFPLTTMTVNVVGCALIGVLMAAVAERPGAPRLLRPLLGTGLLGGFTTFSAWALDLHVLIEHGRVAAAAAYLFVTAAAALAAVWVGAAATRRALARSRR